MNRKYQLLNPNNSRITIDYSKEDPVTFNVIGKESTQKLAHKLISRMWFKYYLFVPIFLLMISPLTLIKNINLKLFLYISICLFVIYLLPYILSWILIRSKKFIKIMPKIWFAIQQKFYYKNFYKQDIKNNKIEIPLFLNIGFDYAAYGDFKKYLKKFEIKEHNFFAVNRKGKRFKNSDFWRATFYFSKEIKEGVLRTRFA